MEQSSNPTIHTARRTIGGTTYIVHAYFKPDTAETAVSTMARVIDLALQAAPRSFLPDFSAQPVHSAAHPQYNEVTQTSSTDGLPEKR